VNVYRRRIPIQEQQLYMAVNVEVRSPKAQCCETASSRQGGRLGKSHEGKRPPADHALTGDHLQEVMPGESVRG